MRVAKAFKHCDNAKSMRQDFSEDTFAGHWTEPGTAKYNRVLPGTVLKSPIMSYILEKQALRGYQI